MRKFSIKTAVSAIFTAAALLGTTCFATGAATSTDSAAADDEVIINYSTQKTDDYLKFSSDNITNSGTLTAKVGDMIEVTVSAKSNDSNFTKFCNGQLVTAFNTSTNEGNSIFLENTGILSYCDDYYKDEDDEFVRLSVNPKIPSPIYNTEYAGNQNVCFFNFTTPENSINLTRKTKIFSFVLKAEKAGTVYLVTNDFLINLCDENDQMHYIQGKADLYTDVQLVKKEEPTTEPTTAEPTTDAPATEPTTAEPTTVAPATEPEPTAPTGEFYVGDVNADGKVNGSDAGILNRYTSGWESYKNKVKNMDAADINRDGKVNGMDAAFLARHTSGWSGYEKYFIKITPQS